MTAKIIKFKKDDNAQPRKKTKMSSRKKSLTESDIYDEVYESVLINWQKAADKNKLNHYVQSKIPRIAKHSKDSDYLNDLNVISSVEQKLQMLIAVFGPAATDRNPNGWLAAFKFNNLIFSTPSDMISEAHARALNIVVYCLFLTKLKMMGRIDN